MDKQRITKPSNEYIYFLLHKPKGVLSTLSDPEGRKTLKPFLRSLPTRVYPVGRLDYNSEGLILLTNDGDLARKLTHPSSNVPKKYEVKVRGTPSEATLESLASGIYLDGRKTLPAGIVFLKRAANSWLEVTLQEGRKQQIRRMFSEVGHPVSKLRRVAIGSLQLGRLPPGEMRPLEPHEVKALKS